jgi:hypothetical protein
VSKSQKSKSKKSAKGPAAAMTPEQRAWHEQLAAQHENARRDQCTRFLFWTVCSNKRCRRTKSCTGDAHACFDQWWPHVPDELRIWYRGALAAQSAGMTREDAAKEGYAELARWRALEAALAKTRGELRASAPNATDATAPVTHADEDANALHERPVARIRLL